MKVTSRQATVSVPPIWPASMMPIFIALLQSLIQISTLDKPTTRFPALAVRPDTLKNYS
jgi:hypothetical protein